jgi:hypothetical protein
MLPYNRITILRNRARAHDLRTFRARVQRYFEQLEYEAEDPLVDREERQSARADINRLFPRIVQVVRAAELGLAAPPSSGNPAGRAVEVLHDIFSPRYGPGVYDEILDVIDMALGVYDANLGAAWVRTINPFHYLMTALAFVAGLPRRALVAVGILRPQMEGTGLWDRGRSDTTLSRPDATGQLIESRFAEMREWQSRLFADHANQVMELAERLDFLERVLAQRQPVEQLKPGEKKQVTPA